MVATVGCQPTTIRYEPAGKALAMSNTFRSRAAAASPVMRANAAASMGMHVRMTIEATTRPEALCGVTSPYPTVAAVTIAQ